VPASRRFCARRPSGPITPERIECSRTTYKQGSDPTLVRLQDDTIFEVNKQKMLKEVVGELVSVTGETKVKDGKIIHAWFLSGPKVFQAFTS